MFFIFVLFILVVLYMFIRSYLMSRQLKQSDIDNYVMQLNEMDTELQITIFTAMLFGDSGRKYGNIPSYREIKSSDDFHISFEALMDVEIMYDKAGNKIAVNQCAWYMVKYYGSLILRYGNAREKAVFVNNVNLLKLNNIIYD